jgi:hypothetical protein
MKKTIIALAAGLACSFTSPTNAEARTTKNALHLGSLSLSTARPVDAAVSGSVKAMRNFKKEFPKIEGQPWSSVKDGWVANFSQHETSTRVFYDQRGNWEYTINYYGEQQMPRNIRAEVKSIYYDYSITGVEEVHVRDQVVYFVHMQDEKTLKMVRVTDDGVDLMEDFNKQ